MSTTLSVIIPVYNVERTLRHCVDSVLAQDVDDMEVILVDDGSTDNSPAICDDYGRQGKARVTHQRNGGLSAARNTGMALATGRFITFVDSDDYIQADTYRPLLSIIGDGYDIVEYPVERETPQGLKLLSYGNHTYTSMQSYWVDARGYEHAYAWNKLYRRTSSTMCSTPKDRSLRTCPRSTSCCAMHTQCILQKPDATTTRPIRRASRSRPTVKISAYCSRHTSTS